MSSAYEFILDRKVKSLIVGLIAGAFASTAFAQSTSPSSAYIGEQNEVAGITQQEAEGADMSPWVAGIAANRDKARRGEPKVLTSTKEKEAVVASVTAQSVQSFNVGARSAGINAVHDRAEKGEPKPLTTNKERQEVVQETTVENAYDH